jgi:hypothetical protein
MFPTHATPSWTRSVISVAALTATALCGSRAEARPGTHGFAVSTWDTRASSVVFSARPGLLSGGHFHDFAYNANFTSTSGNLSAQFGLHYLNLVGGADASTAHGVSGTATALFSHPFGERFDNGIPKAALGFYIGGAPTALSSGERTNVTLPLPLGLGVPWSPGTALTLTPWIEAAPSFNFDTEFKAITVPIPPPDPSSGTVTLNREDVETLVSSAVDVRFSIGLATRAGLDLGIHLGEGVDVNVGGAIGSLGDTFRGPTVFWATAGLVFRWDDIVPAVLPAERRLAKERCDDVEQRWQVCKVTMGPTRIARAPQRGPWVQAASPLPAPASRAPVTAPPTRPTTRPSSEIPPVAAPRTQSPAASRAPSSPTAPPASASASSTVSFPRLSPAAVSTPSREVPTMSFPN